MLQSNSTQHKKKAMMFALCLLLLISSMSLSIIMPVFAILFKNTSHFLSPSTPTATGQFYYSFIIALPVIGMMFGSPLLGALSDQWGRKKILLLSLMGVGLSFMLSIQAIVMQSVLMLFLSRGIAGFMDGNTSIAQAAISDQSLSSEKAKNMSYISLSTSIGFILGPVLGGLLSDNQLVSWFNTYLPFQVAIALVIVNVLLLQYYYQDTMFETTAGKHGGFAEKMREMGQSFVLMGKNPAILQLSLMFFLMEVGWALYFQSIPLILIQLFDFSASQIGYFTAAMGFCFTAAMALMIKIILPKFPRKTVALLGFVLAAIGCWAVSIGFTASGVIWLSLIPVTLGIAFIYNPSLAMLSDVGGKDQQGAIMGINVSTAAAAWLLASILIGLVLHYSPRFLYFLDGLFLLLGYFSLLGFKDCENLQLK